jgi:DHA1 family bicyclomycin/chloramphenicol resistance-like MFS transporter
VVLTSLGLYIAFSLACAMARDFDTLLVLRALQAVGSSGVTVLPGAIIRDRHSGDRMARMLSTISVVFMVVPMLAPSVGSSCCCSRGGAGFSSCWR